ncbi:hypothetical protein F53441_11921 [Fusarium austroafricanum]|uniref:Major facilitator superfamily (MFS) profile domain-containing protein n=1 Tax=Fusarium austroafricanum TaxID=2364996 RepID=A0A8H4K1E3_9HYPO|nr:hypothetical protein F53441_11921 [Fusarium austroafricanum]
MKKKGFPFSFGIFQDYYHSHAPFAGSPGIPAIGTCALGIMYFAYPTAIALQRLYPRPARWAPTSGIISLGLVLVISSFCQNVPQLILTQGVLYALAGSLAYCPCLGWLEEWFVQRRGLAFGIMWSGTGTGGVVIPLMLETLLQRYGFRTTLRIWAVSLIVLSTPAFFFIKPRIPASSIGATRLNLKLGFMYNKTFILYQVASIVESLGYFLPAIYMPIYARSVLQTSSFLSTATIMIFNASMAVGVVFMGFMMDRWHITTCILISTVGAVLSTFFLWGFSSQLAILYLFCIFYGLFAGAYGTTFAGMSPQIVSTSASEEDSVSFDPALVTGFLIAGRGIGNLASGPLSEALFKTSHIQSSATWGLGGYGSVILFTGLTALGGGTPFIWRRLGWL